MSERPDISIIICTYNRRRLLEGALRSALDQQPRELRAEVIVVDNNSTDGTRAMVEALAARHGGRLRYVRETRQGVSYARNTGAAAARAPLLAFADDDVQVTRDWAWRIERAFTEHPEVDFVGGRVLPQWEGTPPAWLTPDHWAPVALQDYGDAPFYVDEARPICLISANLGMRRRALEEIGGFATALQRVKNGIGSMEDAELLARLRRAGRRGLYVPELKVVAPVAAERMTRDYHRRWHQGHGRFFAMMRAEEMESSARGRLFDVPAHLYRQAAGDVAKWLGCMARGRGDRAFYYETRLRFFAGFFTQRRADFLAASRRGGVAELAAFLRAFLSRRPAEDLPKRTP